MRLTEITYGTALAIEGYGPGFFRIGPHVLQGACLVTRWGAGAWGGIEDTAPVLALIGRIDVLFVGMGAEIAQVPRSFRDPIEAAGIGVEVMNSPAACRTYNVLLGEGRRIAAALLPVPGKS
ncbi:MAG: Mth938-like domain-containing protein [Paracoccaceae bacterium]